MEVLMYFGGYLHFIFFLEIKIWNTASKLCVVSFPAHNGFVRGMSLPGDGTRLITCSDYKKIKFWFFFFFFFFTFFFYLKGVQIYGYKVINVKILFLRIYIESERQIIKKKRERFWVKMLV
jgi:WD40 repeat protein